MQRSFVQLPSDHLTLGAAHFIADPAGALYWPQEQILIVADLHFEKGSAYATRRVFLPPYDTGATLASLAALVARHAPRRVLALGDSFHDAGGGDRLLAKDRAALAALQSRREWIWIAGNHDPLLPHDLGGERCAEIAIGGIHFRHAADPTCKTNEITGHLHPVARVAGTAGSVRRRCFVSDGRRCILPALGAYAGGLNLRDAAFAPLFGNGERFAQVHAHVLGRDRVYKVAHRRCLPD
jgi:DNA ligase-associated metallophosphoesterase